MPEKETNERRSTVDWERYRREFPIVAQYIYFNHAAVSPFSTRVKEAVESVSENLLRHGYLCAEELFGRADEVRDAAARLIGGESEEIAFTKNTTQGVLIAANGIHWRSGDNVVMPSIEFPANAYPWIALSLRGVEIRMVEPDEGRVTAEMLADACDQRTRLITTSFVQFSTGYRIDLTELGDFCRHRGMYLHVDGIQALGMIDCDVKKLKIDFLSTGGQKWLLAMPGAGFFYCRKELLDEIGVWNPGWHGVAERWDFLNYDLTYRDSAGRFEEGSLNLHAIFALGASIDMFLEIGMPKVEERILSITDSLARGLEDRGYQVTSPRRSGEHSGIICFVHPTRKTEDIQKTISDAGVVCGIREGAIRLSPHFYNNEEDVEKFLTLLP